MSDYSWQVVYEEAFREDASLYFPERLGQEFLDNKRKILGSYIFANQYLNRVIPDEEQDFKKSWLKYYHFLPTEKYTFITIDPAISLNDGADYTAFCVVHVDPDRNWYVQMANRLRITATDTVQLIFELYDRFNPTVIGIETIAYQQSLIHFLQNEMARRGVHLPLQEIKAARLDKEGGKHTTPSKYMRIRRLVPMFEWGKIFLNQGLHDLEMEFSSFPRGSHDDIIDALARIEDVAYYPHSLRRTNREPQPNDPEYEKWYIRQLAEGKKPEKSGF